MTPKEECEVLLDPLLNAAESLLKKNGEFYPIGAVMRSDGEIVFTAVMEQNDHPDSDTVIASLTELHKVQAEQNEIKASGIAWDAVIQNAAGERQDAIMVSMEHKDAYTVVVGKPYKKGLFKKIVFGQIFAQHGKNDIWKS